MRKKYLFLFLTNLFWLNFYGQLQTRVSFPYQNDLKGPSPSEVLPVGKDEQFTTNGILLTDVSNVNYSRGGVILDGASFSSLDGISIEFEYDMYDGNTFEGRYGDGICLFLYDATASATDLIGGPGGALGYTYYVNKTTGVGDLGLNKAYLGIGLDVYGLFKNRLFNAYSGLYGLPYQTNGSNVTLRGAMRHEPIGPDQTATTSYISNLPSIYNNTRYQGYPILTYRGTLNDDDSLPRGYFLDMSNNSLANVEYTPIFTDLPSNFNIRGGELNPLVTSLSYRKAFINLGPADPAIGGGYYITVDLYNGIQYIRVIDKFHYKESFYYIENSNKNDATPTSYNYLINASIPQEFKIGFSASIGGAAQSQLIKNLVVDLAYTPRFEPDYVLFCENVSEPTRAIIDVFANDFVYNGPIYGPPIQGNGPDFIDYSSFKFTDSEVVPYNDLGTWNGNFLVYEDPNEGVWSYDKTTGLVSFTPNINFSGKAIIYYTAKGTASQGGPFAQDEYYSVPDEIVVEETKCGGFINPQLPFKSENIFTN